MKNYIILLFIFVFTLTSIPTYNFSYSSFEQLYNFEQETYKTELEEELEAALEKQKELEEELEAAL